MGLRRRTRNEPIATSCRPYEPTEALGLHTPRFGGPDMSDVLLDGLEVSGNDRIVEIWPGFGGTTAKLLSRRPRAYRGITADPATAKRLDGALRRAPDLRTLVTRLEAEGVYTGFFAAAPDTTGLRDGDANVVVAESVLTALGADDRRTVLREAARLLATGGRLGIHELCLTPAPSWDGSADAARADEIRAELAGGAGSQLHPMAAAEWHRAIEECGLVVTATRTGPVEPPTLRTLIRDVGVRNFAKGMIGRMLQLGAARSMRELSYVLARGADDLGAIVIIAEKPLIDDLLQPDD